MQFSQWKADGQSISTGGKHFMNVYINFELANKKYEHKIIWTTG